MAEKIQKAIALTIDDGPRESTEKILEILNRYGAHATFFVIGNQINENNASVLRKIIESGSEIGNHGMYHNASDDLIEEEFLKGQEIIEKYAGVTPKVFRTAGLRQSEKIFNTVTLPIIAGYLDCPDWEFSVPVETRIEGIRNNTVDGRVLLTHDNFPNVEAFEVVIPEIIEKGYKILTISEMFETGRITPVKGVMIGKRV